MANTLGFTATPRDPNTVDLTDYFGGFITPGFTPPPDQAAPAVLPPQPPPQPAAPTFGQWLNANSQLVLMGGAAVLILAIVAGGRRR